MRPLLTSSKTLRAGARRARVGVVMLVVAAGAAAADLQEEPAGTSGPSATVSGGAPPSAPEIASGAAVDIQAALGFAGAYRLGGWAPLTVTLG